MWKATAERTGATLQPVAIAFAVAVLARRCQDEAGRGCDSAGRRSMTEEVHDYFAQIGVCGRRCPGPIFNRARTG